MDSCLKPEPASLSGAISEAPDHSAHDRAFASLVQTATLEFLSSLQLLAERALFVTGATAVSIAVREGEQFVYAASAGSPVTETGTSIDAGKKFVAECIANRRASVFTLEVGEQKAASAAVPVVRQEQVAALFELTLDRASFADEDVRAVARLADTVNTVLDHKDAALHAASRIFEKPQPALEAPAALLWHAPRQKESAPQKDENPQSRAKIAANVRTCQSCGFPVSDGRVLCVECEQKPVPAPASDTPHFAIEKQQSWISAHGYTIATLLVTALAAVIILWLR
jgi:hypothetical protein